MPHMDLLQTQRLPASFAHGRKLRHRPRQRAASVPCKAAHSTRPRRRDCLPRRRLVRAASSRRPSRRQQHDHAAQRPRSRRRARGRPAAAAWHGSALRTRRASRLQTISVTMNAHANARAVIQGRARPADRQVRRELRREPLRRRSRRRPSRAATAPRTPGRGSARRRPTAARTPSRQAVDPADVESMRRRSQRQHDGASGRRRLAFASAASASSRDRERADAHADAAAGRASRRPGCRSSGRASRPSGASRAPLRHRRTRRPARRSGRASVAGAGLGFGAGFAVEQAPRRAAWRRSVAAGVRAARCRRLGSQRQPASRRRRCGRLAHRFGGVGAAVGCRRLDASRRRAAGDFAAGIGARLGDDVRRRRGGRRPRSPAQRADGRSASRGRHHRARGALSLRGISIGMSTGIGRGCVSKTSGKPIDADHHQHDRADQPPARARARLLDGVGRRVGRRGRGRQASVLRLKMDNKPMRCRLPGGGGAPQRARHAEHVNRAIRRHAGRSSGAARPSAHRPRCRRSRRRRFYQRGRPLDAPRERCGRVGVA